MPDKTFSGGFSGALTWKNVGTQVANGLISGGASFAMGLLLNGLFSQKEDMAGMFQKFADQIVERLSVKMKEIVAEEFFKNDMQALINRSKSLEQQYRAYLMVGELNLLNDMEEDSFEINQVATSLKLPAIGIFCVQKLVQIAVFVEKGKTNPKYGQLIDNEILSANKHVELMYEVGTRAIDAAFDTKQ